MTHTPGPWAVYFQHMSYPYVAVDGDYKQEVASIRSGNVANARIIAAAPEMLEALRTLVRDGAVRTNRGEQVNVAALNTASEVIAKAEGRGVPA